MGRTMGQTMDWTRFAEIALSGGTLGHEEARAVLGAPDEELLSLVAAAARVRRAHFSTTVKLNFLLNVKSGLCPEDCHYCAQSAIADSGAAKYPILPVPEMLAAAERALKVKAARFCMVASGRGPTDRELDVLTRGIEAVRASHPRLEICACLGLLKDGQAERLRDAGVYAYNHNLNTSERVYGEICSTHTFQDRVETIERAQAAGLSSCSGAIFGMGEETEDILAVASRLRELRADSIPINFLVPIQGTPLANRAHLGPAKCLKILCLFRFLNPAAEIRIAGGREVQLGWLQPLGLHVANSIFIGDYLTTTGQAPQADLAMIRDLGFSVLGHEGTDPLDGVEPWAGAGSGAVGWVTKRPNAVSGCGR